MLKRIGVAGAGVVQQSVDSEQLLLLVGALCSDAVRGVDQAPAQQQLLAVIYNTISLAGDNTCSHLVPAQNLYQPNVLRECLTRVCRMVYSVTEPVCVRCTCHAGDVHK